MNRQHLVIGIFRNAAMALCLALMPGSLFAGSVVATWNANSEPDLAGYKLFYGTASRTYTDSIDVGNVTEQEVSDLTDGVKYFFAVAAYDSSGNQSGYSQEVSKVIGKNLASTSAGNGEGEIRFKPVVGVTEFELYRSRNPYARADTLLRTLTHADTLITDTLPDSTPGTGFYYKIKAKKNGEVFHQYKTVGYYFIELRRGVNLVSLPLVPGDSTLATVLGSQLKGAGANFEADKVHLYNPITGTYETAWRFTGAGPLAGKWVTLDGLRESPLKIRPDESFWIEVRSDSPDTILTISGEVEEDSVRTITLKNGFNFIGTPFPVKVPLDSSNLASVFTGSEFSATSDMLIEWAGNKFKRYWLFRKTGSSLDGKWMDEGGRVVKDLAFKPEKGYVIWKRNQSANNVWTLPNPGLGGN